MAGDDERSLNDQPSDESDNEDEDKTQTEESAMESNNILTMRKRPTNNGKSSNTGLVAPDQQHPQHHQCVQQQPSKTPPQQQQQQQAGGAKSKPKKNTSRCNGWGNVSYSDLITRAITMSPEQKLTLAEIYQYLIDNVRYFYERRGKTESAGWKNSIRHNLSLHNRFQRTQNENSGKSSWWSINHNQLTGKSTKKKGTGGKKQTRDKRSNNGPYPHISNSEECLNPRPEPPCFSPELEQGLQLPEGNSWLPPIQFNEPGPSNMNQPPVLQTDEYVPNNVQFNPVPSFSYGGNMDFQGMYPQNPLRVPQQLMPLHNQQMQQMPMQHQRYPPPTSTITSYQPMPSPSHCGQMPNNSHSGMMPMQNQMVGQPHFFQAAPLQSFDYAIVNGTNDQFLHGGFPQDNYLKPVPQHLSEEPNNRLMEGDPPSFEFLETLDIASIEEVTGEIQAQPLFPMVDEQLNFPVEDQLSREDGPSNSADGQWNTKDPNLQS